MADISDVESALVALIAQNVYPNGTGGLSVFGCDTRIYRGWPTKSQLETALRNGTIEISVYSLSAETNLTRFQTDWRPLGNLSAPTLTLTVSGNTVTVGGTVAVPQNVAIIVDGSAGYSYGVQTTDTLTTIATALAALISADRPGTSSSGAVVTVPGAVSLVGRVGTFGNNIRELKRQRRHVQISLFANTPNQRDQIGSFIDPVLAANEFICLADGTAGRLRYVSSPHDDTVQKEILYRRNLIYSVEYGTTQTRSDPQIIVPATGISSVPTISPDGAGGSEIVTHPVTVIS